MRTKILYTTQRARKGEGRKKIAPVQVPEEVKKMLDEFKDAYSACYGRKVSYEQMFRDWMDHGRIDTKVWKRVQEMKKNSEAFSEVAEDVARKAAEEVARKAAEEVAARSEQNGTSLKEEAFKEKEAAAVDLSSTLLDGQQFHEIVITDDPDEEPVADVSLSQDDVPVQQPEVSEGSPEGGLSAEESRQRLSYWFSDEYKEKLKAERKVRAEDRERRYQALRANKKYFYVKGDERLDARLSKGDGISSSFTADLDGRPRGFDFFDKRGYKLVDEDGNVIDRQTAIDIKKERDDFYSKPTW